MEFIDGVVYTLKSKEELKKLPTFICETEGGTLNFTRNCIPKHMYEAVYGRKLTYLSLYKFNNYSYYKYFKEFNNYSFVANWIRVYEVPVIELEE